MFIIVKSNSNKIAGQRSRKCDIVGCEADGRVLAYLGGMPISYCPHHRKKYGEPLIHAMVNSVFRYKLDKFLSTVRADLFGKDNIFCNECNTKIKEYILSRTDELEKTCEYQEKHGITEIDTKELK